MMALSSSRKSRTTKVTQQLFVCFVVQALRIFNGASLDRNLRRAIVLHEDDEINGKAL